MECTPFYTVTCTQDLQAPSKLSTLAQVLALRYIYTEHSETAQKIEKNWMY